jgi:hypothetical protein
MLASVVALAYPNFSFEKLIISGSSLPQEFVFSDSFVAEVVLREGKVRLPQLGMAIVRFSSCFLDSLLSGNLNIFFNSSEEVSFLSVGQHFLNFV